MLAASARRLLRASLISSTGLESYYKTSTGLVGLAVNPNSREDLIAQSKKLLEKVKVSQSAEGEACIVGMLMIHGWNS